LEGEVDADCLCAITFEIMQLPYHCNEKSSDLAKQYYERASILDWLDRNQTDPMTRHPDMQKQDYQLDPEKQQKIIFELLKVLASQDKGTMEIC